METRWEFPGLEEQIQVWLREDLGTGDLTTNSTIPAKHHSLGIIHAKQAGVIAGVHIAEAVFRIIDPAIQYRVLIQDGEFVKKGTVIAEVEGQSRSILYGERLALNLLQRLSGVASRTHQFVQKIKDLPVQVVDTRKTTPGHRMLEKYAVRIGGGKNHRLGLYDAVLIKDNHIKAAGGIKTAVNQARAAISFTAKVEVEVETLDQVEEALSVKADIIMLDNMSISEMKTAVNTIREANPATIIEASGGISLETLRDIAKTGIDVISVGALTASIDSLDISLDLNEQKGEDR